MIGDLGRLQGGHVAANGVEFRVLRAGDHGPLALCLHGFPDSAYTWRELLPALAERGYRAVAPFMRGYAPTGLAPDARYDVSALADDAIALHQALGGDERAVIIGHDWGADAAYGAGALAPARWRRVVALAVPPGVLDQRLYSDFEQLKRSFYVFLLQTSLAEEVVGANDMEFIDRLWLEWSPGSDSTHLRALAKAEPRRCGKPARRDRLLPADGRRGGRRRSRTAWVARAPPQCLPSPPCICTGSETGAS